MQQWMLNTLRFFSKPISVALIVGAFTAWYSSADYELCLQWRKPLSPGTGLFAQSSSGVCFLYTKDESRPRRYWFLGNEAHSPEVDLQVPEGAIFTGSHFFSDDGKWFAINGGYTNKSSNSIFVFETSTGRLVYDIPSGASKLCFSRNGNLVAFDSRQIECWDIIHGRQLLEMPYEANFYVDEMIFANKVDNLYFVGRVFQSLPGERERPVKARLQGWSISENRELFCNHFPTPAGDVYWWSLKTHESDDCLFGTCVGLMVDAQGESHLDENIIHSWNPRDGRLIRSFSKPGGESYDPISPMDADHFLVFRDIKPNAIRYYWKKWIGNDPGWLKNFLPNRSFLDLREMATGKTLQTMSMGFGHWPRFDTAHGTGLETYSNLNGTEELAFWRIESRNRYLDALLIGVSVTLGTWLLLAVSRRILFRRRSNANGPV